MVRERPLRLVVDVTPRLFGDALCRALRDDTLEVVLMAEVRPGEGSFDLAVTNSRLPAGVSAATVIRIPPVDLPHSEVAALNTASTVDVTDLQQLLRLIREHGVEPGDA